MKLVRVDEYKGFVIYLDVENERFYAKRDDMQLTQNSLKEIKRDIDKVVKSKKEEGYARSGQKYQKCTKTSEYTNTWGHVKYIVVYEDGTRKHVCDFIPYSPETEEIIEEYNRICDEIDKLTNRLVELDKSIKQMLEHK